MCRKDELVIERLIFWVFGGVEIDKPKDLQEVKNFIYDCLKEKYGNSVLSKREDEYQIVIDTNSSFHGCSDVWIDLSYFH